MKITLKTLITLTSLILTTFQINCSDLKKLEIQQALIKSLPKQKIINKTASNNIYLLSKPYQMESGSQMIVKEGNYIINDSMNLNKREKQFYELLKKIDKKNNYFAEFCNYFEYNEKSYLLIQYIKNDMFVIINKGDHKKHFLKRIEIIKKITKGISLLHLNNIINCDIKMENFVMKNDKKNNNFFSAENLRFIDFGGMVIKKNDNVCDRGTEQVSAPEQKYSEILKDKNEFENREKSDIYSLGIMVLILELDFLEMEKIMVLNSDISEENLEKIRRIARLKFEKKIVKYEDSEIKKRIREFLNILVEEMLVYYPSKRISAFDLFLNLKKILTF